MLEPFQDPRHASFKSGGQACRPDARSSDLTAPEDWSHGAQSVRMLRRSRGNLAHSRSPATQPSQTTTRNCSTGSRVQLYCLSLWAWSSGAEQRWCGSRTESACPSRGVAVSHGRIRLRWSLNLCVGIWSRCWRRPGRITPKSFNESTLFLSGWQPRLAWMPQSGRSISVRTHKVRSAYCLFQAVVLHGEKLRDVKPQL